MKSLAVRVLSDFGVDGVEPQALGSKKARTALHLLALAQGHTVRSDLLIDALWGDTPPSNPDDQLAVLMSRLRSVIGRDRIEHRDGGYLLHYDWLDGAELAALLDEVERRRAAGNVIGAAAAARVALSLVEPGSPDRPPGEWAQRRCSDLERLSSRAARIAAAALLDAGDWMAAVDAASATLERDPYDEVSLRVLLSAHVMGGQVAAALAVYADARERLADDLGTDPAPETVALYQAILRGERTASPPDAGGQLGLADIVGRDEELAFLDAVATRARERRTGDGQAEVVVIDGEAGIGKTALLRAWASRRTAAGDTVLMAACGQLDRAMPLDAVLGALAAALRRAGPDVAADLLGSDTAVLAPLLRPVSSAPVTAGSQYPLDEPTALPHLADSMLGPRVLYAALCRVFGRLIHRGPVVLIVDDAHLVGQPLPDLLDFVARERIALPVIAAVRGGAAQVHLPATAQVHLDALDRAAAAELVGATRVDELFARSKGHPLFLTELAQQSASAELPASLVESVSLRCDELGTAGTLLRTAAVIEPELDIELLAAILGQPVVRLLDDAECAVSAHFLVEDSGTFTFRHELVRDALAASASPGRAALLHRQAGRVLARRAADPVIVANHARLGGDLELAANALCDASLRAAERFDHAAAEALLDEAITLHPAPAAWLARARVRTRRRHYTGALEDVERASEAGSAALEVGAWASYFDRRFASAAQFAEDGALAAADPVTRARCLAVGGRTWHAAGDLAQAESRLLEALTLAQGADRVTAAAWLGVLRSHQSRTSEAVSLLRTAARGQIGVEHTSATLHALLFTGHAHAIAGQPALALEAFARYDAEVERRQVPRFGGRAVNFSGWVLRNLGADSEAVDKHVEALDIAQRHGTAEVTIAALEDLAEHNLDAGDFDASAARLAQAGELITGDLVFGWRLDCKRRLISARLALRSGADERARAEAAELESRAVALGVPRYVSAARLIRHRAEHALGLPVYLAEVESDLEALDSAIAIEAWWWTGEVAAEFAIRPWLDRAAHRAKRLADNAGQHADLLRSAADGKLDDWSKAVG